MAKKVKVSKEERLKIKEMRQQAKAEARRERDLKAGERLEESAVRKMLKALQADLKVRADDPDAFYTNVADLVTRKARNEEWLRAVARGLNRRIEEARAALDTLSSAATVARVEEARRASKAASKAAKRVDRIGDIVSPQPGDDAAAANAA